MGTSDGPCDATEKPKRREDRFVFYAALPSLQEMACVRVALSIWYSYLSRSKCNSEFKKETKDDLADGLGIANRFWEQCNEIVESLKMPRSVEELLKNTVDSVCDEMRSWIEHFKLDTFSHYLRHYCMRHFDANCCVWLPNGKINYELTAAKMLRSDESNDVQRFAIMCEFCMETELKNFDVRLLPKRFLKRVRFERDYLIYYWICYLKNELFKIPLQEFNSTDVVMAVMCEDEHQTAFDYFWNRLGADDQVLVAIRKLEHYSTHSYQSKILTRMSWDQQLGLLAAIPDRMLINFWIHLDSTEAAMWTWKHSKHLMTAEQFANVVKDVFYRKMSSDEEMRLLMEIWNSASDEQRYQVVCTTDDDFIRPFFCMSSHSRTAFKFLRVFLSTKSVQFRRETILRNAAEFGSHIVDPASMDEIIDLCLPDTDDQLQYKRLIMNSHEMNKRGEMLFNDCDFHSLKFKIQYYSVDSKVAQNYVELLFSSKGIRKLQYIIDANKWNKLNEFVDDIFSNDIQSGLNLKKKFIKSIALDCRNDWNDDHSLDEMVKVLDKVFTSEDELQVIKKDFLNAFRKLLVDSDYWPWFEQRYMNKFVSWCVGLGEDDETVEQDFKNSVNVDSIFDEYFDQFDLYYSEDGDFDQTLLSDLDTALRWYFMGAEGANDYKLRRINDFDGIKIFNTIIERDDRKCLEVILKWVFGHAEEAMRKFKAKHFRWAKATSS